MRWVYIPVLNRHMRKFWYFELLWSDRGTVISAWVQMSLPSSLHPDAAGLLELQGYNRYGVHFLCISPEELCTLFGFLDYFSPTSSKLKWILQIGFPIRHSFSGSTNGSSSDLTGKGVSEFLLGFRQLSLDVTLSWRALLGIPLETSMIDLCGPYVHFGLQKCI